jgi:hypothetical protein
LCTYATALVMHLPQKSCEYTCPKAVPVHLRGRRAVHLPQTRGRACPAAVPVHVPRRPASVSAPPSCSYTYAVAVGVHLPGLAYLCRPLPIFTALYRTLPTPAVRCLPLPPTGSLYHPIVPSDPSCLALTGHADPVPTFNPP